MDIELAINRPHELPKVLEQIVEATSRFFPATGGASICLWDEKTETFTISASNVRGQERESTARRVRKKGGATRWIIDHSSPFIVPDILQDPFTPNPMLSEFGLRAYAGMPLLMEGKVLGVLYALDDHPRTYTEKDMDFLSALADRAAVAISKVRVYEELRAMNQRLVEQSRRLELANRELKDFAHVISHDLKAPLYGIATLVHWLEKDHLAGLDQEGRKQMQLMKSRLNKMENLIDGLLALSRIERDTGEYEEVDVNVLIREVVDLLHCPDHIRIEIKTDFPILRFERMRLHQVFQNLIQNAIQAIDKDKGLITVQGDDLRHFYQFRITDNGVGIEEGHRNAIFQMFFPKRRPTHQEESSGLGLSIVKKIIETNGGKIWCESEVGTGTTFYFTIPRPISTTSFSI